MSIATLSDHTQRRGLFCVIFGFVSVVGYGVLISPSSAGVHYFGSVHFPFEYCFGVLTTCRCFLVAMGFYVLVGLPLAWVSCAAHTR